jgi:hypothetical protein
VTTVLLARSDARWLQPQTSPPLTGHRAETRTLVGTVEVVW